uniref:Tnp_DDE_dom domain-containing protein n=1 Tax=Strongyloides papillosus TaxID=174720 RepID=A0A0N5B1X5_STREA
MDTILLKTGFCINNFKGVFYLKKYPKMALFGTLQRLPRVFKKYEIDVKGCFTTGKKVMRQKVILPQKVPNF